MSAVNDRSGSARRSVEGGGAPADRLAASDHPEAERPIDWHDFRDHLATADQEGHRRWLFPRQPSGRWYRRRSYVSWVLLAVMFVGPFVKIHGNPLLLINILERKFSILGQIFWPQDAVIFAVAMLVFLTGIILFTTAFGRLWCGWTCPQTVLMEMVFRKIEYAIDGDAHHQRALAAAPWTATKVCKRLLKHGLFLAMSFVVGNTLLSYIIGVESLFTIMVDDPRAHAAGLTSMLVFTGVFYLIFARFREQACTFICPYGRFQSTMLDENSMVVAYDHRRGEKRAPLKRDRAPAQRQAEGFGDCVQCRQCVAVCPTGIDIRDGIQMECVHCTACMDACDGVMERIGRPRGLIRYASLNSIQTGQRFRFTARMGLYATVLTGLIAAFLVLVFTRSDVETAFLRAPGALFQRVGPGRLSNLFTLKVVNKTSRDLPIELKLEEPVGTLRVMGGSGMVLRKEGLLQTSVLVELEDANLTGGSARLRIGIYSRGRLLERVRSRFAGPRGDTL